MARLHAAIVIAALLSPAAQAQTPAAASPPPPYNNADPYAPHVTDFGHGMVATGLAGYTPGMWAPFTLTPDGRLRTDLGGGAQTALVAPAGSVTSVGSATAVTVLPASAVSRALWLGNPAPPGSGTLYCSPVATASVGGANTFPIPPGSLLGFGPTDPGLTNAWSCIASAGTLAITVLGY